MRILIINTADCQGGAARASYRLHKALRIEGVDSTMLVQSKSSDDYTVLGPETKINKLIGRIRLYLDILPLRKYKQRTKTLFSPAWIPFSKTIERINEINPDIVHLHWITGGMIRIEEIKKIKAPIIWSLHDNWAFTGGCHIKWSCEKYKNCCGACPILSSNSENDLSKQIWKRKRKTYAKLNDLTVIGLSHWMMEIAKKSNLLKDKNIINLPNPIDISMFKPLDKAYSRLIWNLPPSKKLILFGALDATSDINKGFEQLLTSLSFINDDHVELIVFGSSEPKTSSVFNFRTHYLGQLQDDICLTALYNAADVMVVPSLQENLSNAIMESLACGTPVVAFNVGGNADMIEHLKNGYLAQPLDCEDLAKGIKWVLGNEKYDELTINARKKIVEEFDSKLVAKRYIDLYKSILDSKQRAKS